MEMDVLLSNVISKSIKLRQRDSNGRNEESEREKKLVADGAAIRQLAKERRRMRSRDAEEGSNGAAARTY